MEKLAKVPPEKTSNKERSGLPAKSAAKVPLSIPAAGMWPAKRKTTRIKAVTKIFLRTLGVFQALEKNWPIELNIKCTNDYNRIQENSQAQLGDELNPDKSFVELHAAKLISKTEWFGTVVKSQCNL